MYTKISDKLKKRMEADRARGAFFGTPDSAADRLYTSEGDGSFRPPFVRDIAKMINLPVYIRLQDKTQVLSMIKNDDISHRMSHVQYVSRIARDISRALGYNLDLTEAIALGHDIGHAPFGHMGEKALDGLTSAALGIRFNHNVQSVRALTRMYGRNMTVQTLDGILCHNGEAVGREYKKDEYAGADGLFARMDECEKNAAAVGKLVPQTIEGCVVRVSDVIAYLGKDRQDAIKFGLVGESDFVTGASNAELINNISVDIIEHSYDSEGSALRMSNGIYELLKKAMRENYDRIYLSDKVKSVYAHIEPMFAELFEKLCADIENNAGFCEKYFISPVAGYNPEYRAAAPARIACDFIASMTDDFFIAAYERLTGKKSKAVYRGYFE